MPIPAPASRIAERPLVLQAQGTVQPGIQREAGADRQVLPPGTEEAHGAFGIFGMMISGLIILAAVVFLVWKARRRG